MPSLLTSMEHARIERAIAAAELRTSGELRVIIHPDRADDPLAVAAAEFAQLGMHRTRLRNAVLILFAPNSRTFAIHGDEAIHAHCGQSFWQEVAGAMETHFRRGAFAEGLIEGVTRAGDVLAKSFPRADDDVNELSNDVVDRGIVI